jgi:hypothetical protein
LVVLFLKAVWVGLGTLADVDEDSRRGAAYEAIVSYKLLIIGCGLKKGTPSEERR